MEPVWSALGQAAGVAAALAVEHGLPLGEVPIRQIQDELVRQGGVLFFYTDLPKTAPAFEAVQKLSLLGAFENTDPDRFQTDGPAASLSDLNKKVYRFRPNDPVSLGEFARMAVRGLQIPLSITAAHFNDIPRNHVAFKYIETLYDHSTQSQEPFLDYDILREPEKRARVLARPDQELSSAYATKILTGLLRKEVPSLLNSNASLTRGEATQLIYQQIKRAAE
jgi:hypothetical protein